MFTTHVAINHQVAVARHQEFLAEARLQHDIDNAFGENRRFRRTLVAEVRAAVATLLLRFGAWLMPVDAAASQTGRINGSFELRPGR